MAFHRFFVALFAVAAMMVSVPGNLLAADAKPTSKAAAETQRKLGRKLLAQLREQYATFKRDVIRTRKKSAAERVAVVKKHTATMNALLKDHTKSLAMKEVLPEITNIMGVDLAPTLMAVVKNSPHSEVQAMAIYALAVHLHKTGRSEKKAVALLKHVEKNFAKLPHGESTLGEIAARKRYEIENLAIGKPAPDVQGVDADGAKFRLSDYQGKVIVLRFWGDWCPFCRAMFPQERELVNTLRDKPFVLIGVNSDPRARLKKAQKEKNLVWRSFWDGGATGGPIARTFQVTEWPTIYVIDHNGIIRDKGEGVRGGRAKWLEPVIKKLIAEAERDEKTVSVK